MADSTHTDLRKLSVLMPVYNESKTLASIVERVFLSPIALEIELVAVDDASSDGSLEILRELASADPRLRVFAHASNRGKGAAIRTAIEHMTGDVAIVQDSDLEYDPGEFPIVLRPILDGRADAVYGSRFASSPERRVLMFWHSLGNKLLTALSNMVNDLNLTDMETCYKAVRADVLKGLRLQSDRFGIEPEITTRLAQSGARIYEVPISYHGRTYDEGKHIGWRDGLQALWLIFKYRFIDTEFSTSGRASQLGLAKAKAYGRWLLDELAPYLGSRVAELGAGVGNFTRLLLHSERLLAIESDQHNREILERRFGRLPNVTVTSAEVDGPEQTEGFDSILSVNALSQAESPGAELREHVGLVRPGGHVVVVLPAHKSLTTQIDSTFLQRRRYEPDHVRDLLDSAGLEVVEVREFNRMGVFGWMATRFIGQTSIGSWQARVFGLLVPVARRYERLALGPGLSVIGIGRRPDRKV